MSKCNSLYPLAYSEPCQSFKMHCLAEIVNDLKPLTIFAKCSVLDL